MDVSLFITCLADGFYPRAGIAVVKTLEYLGCRVDFPQGQTCCGQPMFNNGFHEEARELGKRLIGAFEHSRCVVTPSGSCAAMVREQYPRLFHNDHAYEHAAAELAGKTYEFTEFLVKVLRVDLKALGARLPAPRRVTYHYSCHLRGLGLTDEAIQLLKQIENLEFVALAKMDQCCGFGGMFATKYPQVSGLLVADKVAAIAQTGAQTVVATDSGCTMNISGACHRAGQSVEFVHLAEIIAESLGIALDEHRVAAASHHAPGS